MLSIKFNSEIYTKKAIKSAFMAYKKIVSGKMFSKGVYYIVSLKVINEKYINQPVAEEFSNYVLAESIK